jgi:hypothetical protein
MKKTLTTITLAAILTLGSTFANAGIIVAGSPGTQTCEPAKDGIIVAGRAIVNVLFGIIVAGNPGTEKCVESDGIIVAG